MATDLGPFEVGQIWVLHKEGYSHRQIRDRVTRGRDGSGLSLSAVADTVRRLLAEPSWAGLGWAGLPTYQGIGKRAQPRF